MNRSSERPIKVSVVVPVFNGEGRVRRCLDSILGQTLREIEVLAVDDCSEDNSLRILQELAKSDERLIPIASEKNEGVNAARAKAIRRARGEYVGFADADDWIDSKMLEQLYRRAQTDGSHDIAMCGARTIDADHERTGMKASFPDQVIEGEEVFQAFCELRLRTAALWNKIIRQPLIAKHAAHDWGWRPDAVEDTLACIGCFAEARSVATLSEVHYNYVLHDSNATVTAGNALAFARILRAYASAISVYETLSPAKLSLIDSLYRKQLEYPSYHIADPQELEPHRDLLLEAVAILSERRPSALYEFANLGLTCPTVSHLHAKALPKWLKATKNLGRSVARAVLRR